MVDPYEAAAREEAALLRALWGEPQSFFARLRLLPSGLLGLSIRRSSILPTVRSSWWANAVASLEASALRWIGAAWRVGGRGAATVLPGSWAEAVERLATGPGELEAVRLIRGIDAANRRGLSRLIRSAADRYRRNPSPKILAALTEEIRPRLGLTPWQVSQSKKLSVRLGAQGLPPTAIAYQVRRQAREMIARRAAYVAERGVVEAVAASRHALWVEALHSGAISEAAMKRARHRGDDRVRTLHRIQGDLAPIPLEAPYAIFRAAHPPWPGEPNCRCWEELLLPEEAATATTSASSA